LIERFFNKIKQCRRVATRYDKLAANYLAFIKLASIRIWLRANESASQFKAVSIISTSGGGVRGAPRRSGARTIFVAGHPPRHPCLRPGEKCSRPALITGASGQCQLDRTLSPI
jgi:hypothetical protein